MSRRTIFQIAAILYFLLYLSAMVLPRKLPNSQHSSGASSFSRIFHGILYYDGPLELVANFLFLIPIFLILLNVLGSNKSLPAVYICIVLAGSAEIAQRFIPGRVSSLQDFLSNLAGASAAYFVNHWAKKPKTTR